MLRMFLPVLLSCFIFSCAEKTAPRLETPPPPPEAALERGKVIDAVPVAGSAGESYAAFVPSKGDAMPLLLLFDSHARGKMVVNLYREMAEKQQVILIASNSSKNGMDLNAALSIGGRMMNSALSRTPANKEVIWAGGFSGGARVAAQFALAQPKVNGVIGIGASFDPITANGHDLDFFGIAGMKDFNFGEMMRVDSLREAQGQQGFLLLTSGGHEWPTEEVMARSVKWQWLESIRDGNLVQDITPSFDPLAEYKAWNDAFPESTALTQVMRMRYCLSAYGKLADTAPLEAELKSALQTPGYGAGLRQRQEAQRWEEQNLQRLQPMIGTLTLPEWEREIRTLTEGASSRSELAFAHQRVLNALSLIFYMQSNGALQQVDLAAADHFLTLYAKVDPTNSEHAYLRADYWMLKGQQDNALAALEQAVALGFSDQERLLSDPAMQGMQTQLRFQAIVQQLKD